MEGIASYTADSVMKIRCTEVDNVVGSPCNRLTDHHSFISKCLSVLASPAAAMSLKECSLVIDPRRE